MRPATAAIVLSLAVLAVFAVTADASDADAGYHSYDSETRTLTITGDVPDLDYSASDAPWAAYASEIRSIVVTKDVSRIGNNAFAGCVRAAKVTIEGPAAAGTDAFRDTGSLMDGFDLVYNYAEIPDSMFSCTAGEVRMNSADLSSVRTVGTEAFRGVRVESITLPDSVGRIGDRAFSGCMLKHLRIGGNPALGDAVFMSCTSLGSADIQFVTAIPDSMFSGCSSLSDVQFSRSMVSAGQESFRGTGLKALVFPGTMKVVGNSAFSGCIALEHVAFTGNLDSMGDKAFSDCTVLKKVEIQSVGTAGTDVFIGCGAIERAYTEDIGSFTFPPTTRVYHDLPESSADVLIRYDFGEVGGGCVLFSDTPMSSSYIAGSEGHRFERWEDALGNTVSDPSSLTGSQTLTAVWAQAEGTEGTFAVEAVLCVLSVICAATACAFCLRRA